MGKKPNSISTKKGQAFIDKHGILIHSYNENTELTLTAAALLITNPVNRIIGTFYMGLNKTAFPFRLFTENEKPLKLLAASGEDSSILYNNFFCAR
jgi:hypothetical protein